MITAAFWWRTVGDAFDRPLAEFLVKAKEAELEQSGHDCGHRFEVTVASSLHISGPGDHTDADYFDVCRPVTVRAHNLRDALLLAAAEPLTAWFEADEDADPLAELARADARVREAEEQLVQLVADARKTHSWAEVGVVFGVTRQAAWARFASRVDAMTQTAESSPSS